jgi:hypothetical protein
MSKHVLRQIKRARVKLDKLYFANDDAGLALEAAEMRIKQLEAALKRIAKTANYQKDWGIIVECFSKDEFEIKEYVQWLLEHD